jgi:hypothetical protein
VPGDPAGDREHADLGDCGGGHHDAGAHFPIASFIAACNRILHPSKPSLPRWYVRARSCADVGVVLVARPRASCGAPSLSDPGRVSGFGLVAAYAAHAGR